MNVRRDIPTRSGLPLVIVIDDRHDVLDGWRQELAGYGVFVMCAATLDEARRFCLNEHGQIDGIILDGCVPGHKLNTVPFIDWLLDDEGYRGPLVAASSLPGYREQMLRAGCTHQAPKPEAVDVLVELLTNASVNVA